MITSRTKILQENLQPKTVVLRGISKKYPLMRPVSKDVADFKDFWALKDISFEVYQGQVLGIIGRNGAGKTTLLNIISGVISPTYGEVSVNGKVLGLFNLGVGFQDELTGKENIFLNGTILGFTRKEIEDRLSAIIDFSELGEFINMPLGSYSQGMRLRLGFSIIANLDFDILIIDEVLAVGDALFQSKCFERLMDFKRGGKTLIITTQSMDLIERLSNKVALLDHGHLLFDGNVIEGINKYRALLGAEKFFVGPGKKNIKFVENTKKWADNLSDWGKKFGTKDVVIDKVEFINKFGRRCESVKSGDPLRVKVNFVVRNSIKEPHFGVAIFRNDGVYCYGPNTAFEGYKIPELKKGKGYFILNYRKVLLAPGEYRISIAIWDKNETLAFDYHYGYYKLMVTGYNNDENELLNIPFRFNLMNAIDKLILLQRRSAFNLSQLADKWGERFEDNNNTIKSIKFLNSLDEKKDFFMTDELVKINITFNDLKIENKKYWLWIGIYREDKIYCQGFSRKISYKNKKIALVFPRLKLLPGAYKISIGIWDNERKEFIAYHHGIYPLKVVFSRNDHGTVFLEHKWKMKLP